MEPKQDAVFKSLADPTRRGLFERLARGGETTVVELTRVAGVSQPVVSKHLGKLREAGLVTSRPEGRTMVYTAELAGLRPLVDWTTTMTDFWNHRLDELGNLLEKLDQ